MSNSHLRPKVIRFAAALPKDADLRTKLVAILKNAHPLDRVRRHKLMPAEIRSKIPPIGAQDDSDDPIVWVKFFSPYGNGQATWLITEFDGNNEMFGWAELFRGGGELGYISLSHLEGLNRNGLPLVERDTSFKPMPLSKARRM